MFALSFDLVVKVAEHHHPRSDSSYCYREIRGLLNNFGFERVQGSVYVT